VGSGVGSVPPDVGIAIAVGVGAGTGQVPIGVGCGVIHGPPSVHIGFSMGSTKVVGGGGVQLPHVVGVDHGVGYSSGGNGGSAPQPSSVDTFSAVPASALVGTASVGSGIAIDSHAPTAAANTQMSRAVRGMAPQP